MQLNSQSIFFLISALPCEEKLLFSITGPTDGAGVCVTFPVWLPEVASNATPGVCSLIRTGISKVFPITCTEPGSLFPWVNGDQVHLISHQQIALTHLPCNICRASTLFPYSVLFHWEDTTVNEYCDEGWCTSSPCRALLSLLCAWLCLSVLTAIYQFHSMQSASSQPPTTHPPE